MKLGNKIKKWQVVSEVFHMTADKRWVRYKKFPFLAKPDKLAKLIDQMRERNLELINEDKFWYYFH